MTSASASSGGPNGSMYGDHLNHLEVLGLSVERELTI